MSARRGPDLSAGLDVAWWYLVMRNAPTRSSPIEPEHFDHTSLAEAWRRASQNNDWTFYDLGLSDAQARKLQDHEGPSTEYTLRQAEQRLVEEWAKRVLLDAADKLIDRQQRDPSVRLSDCLEHLREAIAMADSGSLRRSMSAREVRAQVVHEVVGAWRGERPKMNVPIGIRCIQRDIGGFRRGKLAIWGGRTGGHKTTVARQCAEYCGRFFDTLVVPLEDYPVDFESRSIVANDDMLTTRDMHRDESPESVPDAVERLVRSVDQAPEKLRYVSTGRIKLEKLISVIRAEYTRGLAAVFIDHLHRLPQGRDGPEFWGRVGNELGDLARELNIAIIGMGQLDKVSTVEAAGGKQPTTASLQFGTRLTQPARSAYMIHPIQKPKNPPKESRDGGVDAMKQAIWEVYKSGRKVLKIVCEKNTNGTTGSWLVRCDPAHDLIEEELTFAVDDEASETG